MRVIAGSARGFKLLSVPGDSTRPITDRAKEALFSILGDWIDDTRVLDLFGGTGAVGIEALSRGAAFVQFIDRNRKAVQTIQANLAHCKFADQATVAMGDSFAFLQSYRGEPFDLIYVAPPQYQGLWHKALTLIDQRPQLLAPFGAVIVQIHPREDQALTLTFLEEYDRRTYGSVHLIFYASSEDLAADDEDEDDEEDDFEEDGEDYEDEEMDEEQTDDDMDGDADEDKRS
jgi:16S rRNA (guanine966-N2)-methyltransferase